MVVIDLSYIFSRTYTAKRSIRQEISLDLPGLDTIQAGGEAFDFELSVPPSSTSSDMSAEQLGRWLTVTPMVTDIQTRGERLRYMLSWEPEKKMMPTMMELVVMRKMGGGRYVCRYVGR